jgi:Xaa-Pro aminopeptidase
MFDKKVYEKRRNNLKKKLNSGLVYMPGNIDSPMNYRANQLPFRQDSNFLYFFGIDKPGFSGLIDIDEEKDYLFGNDFDIDDIIWMGNMPTVSELGKLVGAEGIGVSDELAKVLKTAINRGKRVHYLPPYKADTVFEIERLLGIKASFVNEFVSEDLIRAVVELRNIKSDLEVKEIEKALDISYDMLNMILTNTKPGILEQKLVGKMEGILSQAGSHYSFPIILSKDGQTLHNHNHNNVLKDGDLLLIDSGAESPEYYASDITRTYPVSGKFTEKQRDIYQIVLNSQEKAISMIRAGVKNKNVHIYAAEVIASGLKDLGFLKGNLSDIVQSGAHALFFPHGLGHMMGLDVHDMEGLGENFVGYDKSIKRSDQFGLAFLRLAKELELGNVLTVEPGIYFIPDLIQMWKKENKLSEFINYSKAEEYIGFGGIRIEDDILVQKDGAKVLGKLIPKSIEDIEAVMRT